MPLGDRYPTTIPFAFIRQLLLSPRPFWPPLMNPLFERSEPVRSFVIIWHIQAIDPLRYRTLSIFADLIVTSSREFSLPIV